MGFYRQKHGGHIVKCVCKKRQGNGKNGEQPASVYLSE